jgi:uncharacterized protein with HEPN domain
MKLENILKNYKEINVFLKKLDLRTFVSNMFAEK